MFLDDIIDIGVVNLQIAFRQIFQHSHICGMYVGNFVNHAPALEHSTSVPRLRR